MTVQQIIKALKQIENRRFSVELKDDNSIELNGFSFGYHGDYMYTKFHCTVTVGDVYTIRHVSDLHIKDKFSGLDYSTYVLSDHAERFAVVTNVDKLIHYFTNENLSSVSRSMHDWDIELVE